MKLPNLSISLVARAPEQADKLQSHTSSVARGKGHELINGSRQIIHGVS